MGGGPVVVSTPSFLCVYSRCTHPSPLCLTRHGTHYMTYSLRSSLPAFPTFLKRTPAQESCLCRCLTSLIKCCGVHVGVDGGVPVGGYQGGPSGCGGHEGQHRVPWPLEGQVWHMSGGRWVTAPTVRVCECASVQVCNCASVQVCKCASVQVSCKPPSCKEFVRVCAKWRCM